MKRLITTGIALMSLWIMLTPVSARAQASITYDVWNVGGNIWQYDYYLNGLSIQPDQGFKVEFDWKTYSNLAAANSPTGWNPLVLQPDPAFWGGPENGYYDSLALITDPSSGPLSVTFAWNDIGTPGAQYFEFYQMTELAGFFTFTPLPISGWTTATLTPGAPDTVPEPGTGLLLLSGLSIIGGYFWKRHGVAK